MSNLITEISMDPIRLTITEYERGIKERPS